MDLSLNGKSNWIAGSFCILASFLWHALWTVLTHGRNRKTSATGNMQVVEMLLNKVDSFHMLALMFLRRQMLLVNPVRVCT